MCCNVIYNVISKITASRLKATLLEAIELNQCAFVEGRLLLENIILATKLVKDYHKSSVSSTSAIKMDISKAFNSVSWSFIEATFRAMNYPDIFCYLDNEVYRNCSFLSVSQWRTRGFFH